MASMSKRKVYSISITAKELAECFKVCEDDALSYRVCLQGKEHQPETYIHLELHVGMK